MSTTRRFLYQEREKSLVEIIDLTQDEETEIPFPPLELLQPLEPEFEIKAILGMRLSRYQSDAEFFPEFLIQWMDDSQTWEPEEHLLPNSVEALITFREKGIYLNSDE